MTRRCFSIAAGATIALVSLACANHPPLLDRLASQRETDRFMVCARASFHEWCPGDQINQRPCVDRHAAEYIAEPTEHERQRWLDQHGCAREASGYEPTSEEQFGHVTTRVDEFTRARSIEYRSEVGGLLTSFAGGSGYAFLMLSSGGREWRYLECHHVNMLVNGAPVDVGAAEHRGTVHAGGVGESVTINLAPDLLRTLQSAMTIRFRICRDTFSFEPGAVVRIRDFATQAQALSSTPPVAATSP